jgi:nucleotide-binding universal stress UspA family protein
MKPKNTPRSPASAKTGQKKVSAAKAAAKSSAPIPVHIKEILVPVDFSEHSRAAMRYALAFADRFKARIALVHIVEQLVYPGDWVIAPVPGPAFVTERTDDLVQRLREFAGSAGKKITPVVRIGRAWQQVVEVAEARKSDLIITATHGHTGLKHVLLGSVAEKIVRHAHCPVLTVRAE